MAFNFGRGLSSGLSGAATGFSLGGPWGAAIGGGLGALGGFGRDPEDEAKKYLNQIPGQIKPYYEPYIQGGNWAQPELQKQFGQLMSDPNAVISRLGAGYKASPGYQWRLGQGEAAINNANAAGGMLGTNQHQQQAGKLAGDLADQDYQNYLNSAMGLYGTGLSGAQDMAHQGLTAGSDLATSLANLLQGKAGLGYKGAANENQSNSDLMSSIMAALTSGHKTAVGGMPAYAQNALYG